MSEAQNSNPAQTETHLLAFDLSPDGRITMSSSEVELYPDEFAALPANESQWENGWHGEQPYGVRVTYKALPSARPDAIKFCGVSSDPLDRIYLITSQSTYQFDGNRGLVTASILDNSQGYGFVGKGHAVDELTNEVARPRAWLEPFARDCDVYFAAETRYANLIKKDGLDPAQTDADFAAAKAILATALNQVTSTEIIHLLDSQISALAEEAQFTRQGALSRHAILNKPAPDWNLIDLAGAKHSLADYRGKVVLLDFWYRGCGWCMRAMPEVKQLAIDFAGKPVAILAMNTDSNPADAKFVADAFALGYPVLHVTREILLKYQVHAFPTIIIIGPDGIIRDMEVGYQPNMHDVLGAKITALMPVK